MTMSDNVEHLLLEHLRSIRSDVSDIKAALKDHTSRFGRIEIALARVGREQADLYTEQVDDRRIIDGIKERLERIERRLDLTE